MVLDLVRALRQQVKFQFLSRYNTKHSRWERSWAGDIRCYVSCVRFMNAENKTELHMNLLNYDKHGKI